MRPLEEQIKEQAHQLGFELAGIAPATEADNLSRLREWLDRGFAGAMAYMENQAAARRHPSSILPEVRSVVMVGMNYQTCEERPSPSGPIARYARGADYHDVLRQCLNQLLAW